MAKRNRLQIGSVANADAFTEEEITGDLRRKSTKIGGPSDSVQERWAGDDDVRMGLVT